MDKPFLLIAHRRVDRAADGEYEAMLRHSGLDEGDLRRVRIEQAPLGAIDLDDWSGIILGGGPFNASDPEEGKSDVQRRAETELRALLDEVVDRDFPFLGCCYGIGLLGLHQGGTVDTTYSEPVGPMTITLTDDGRADPVFGSLPSSFEAYLGHKEAMHTLPAHAVHLASSPTCPVQAFRVHRNVYATQFHPELDLDGLATRIDVYKHAGYFAPEEAEALLELGRSVTVVHPPAVLRNFVERHAVRTSPTSAAGARASRAE